MAIRSIASLSLSFGLVSIPVKLYSATESSAALRFKLMSSSGATVRQQYVATTPPPAREAASPVDAKEEQELPQPSTTLPARAAGASSKVVDIALSRSRVEPPAEEEPRAVEQRPEPAEPVIQRSAMVKGYEYQKGKYVLFTSEELKSMEAGSRKTIDIVSFVPQHAVDPVFYDKAYFLAPDKRGAKPYGLLLRAMRDTNRCAIAKWAYKSKEYVVQIRPAGEGIVLQQLFYSDEVRSVADLKIERADISESELALAKQLIAQISTDVYDPAQFVDEEKARILEAVQRKIAGQDIAPPAAAPSGGKVIDLMEALRASLKGSGTASGAERAAQGSSERRPAKRAGKASSAVSMKPVAKRSGKRTG